MKPLKFLVAFILLVTTGVSEAQWGYGMYGTMPVCPYPYGPGSGAVSKNDFISELKRERKDIEKRLRDYERQQERLLLDIGELEVDLGEHLSEIAFETVTQHLQTNNGCCYKDDCEPVNETGATASNYEKYQVIAQLLAPWSGLTASPLFPVQAPRNYTPNPDVMLARQTRGASRMPANVGGTDVHAQCEAYSKRELDWNEFYWYFFEGKCKGRQTASGRALGNPAIPHPNTSNISAEGIAQCKATWARDMGLEMQNGQPTYHHGSENVYGNRRNAYRILLSGDPSSEQFRRMAALNGRDFDLDIPFTAEGQERARRAMVNYWYRGCHNALQNQPSPNPELGANFLEFARNVQGKLGFTDGRLQGGSQGTWLHDLPGGLFTADRPTQPRNVRPDVRADVSPAVPIPVPNVVATVTEDEPQPEPPQQPRPQQPAQPQIPPVAEPQPEDPRELPGTVDTDDEPAEPSVPDVQPPRASQPGTGGGGTATVTYNPDLPGYQPRPIIVVNNGCPNDNCDEPQDEEPNPPGSVDGPNMCGGFDEYSRPGAEAQCCCGNNLALAYNDQDAVKSWCDVPMSQVKGKSCSHNSRSDGAYGSPAWKKICLNSGNVQVEVVCAQEPYTYGGRNSSDVAKCTRTVLRYKSRYDRYNKIQERIAQLEAELDRIDDEISDYEFNRDMEEMESDCVDCDIRGRVVVQQPSPLNTLIQVGVPVLGGIITNAMMQGTYRYMSEQQRAAWEYAADQNAQMGHPTYPYPATGMGYPFMTGGLYGAIGGGIGMGGFGCAGGMFGGGFGGGPFGMAGPFGASGGLYGYGGSPFMNPYMMGGMGPYGPMMGGGIFMPGMGPWGGMGAGFGGGFGGMPGMGGGMFGGMPGMGMGMPGMGMGMPGMGMGMPGMGMGMPGMGMGMPGMGMGMPGMGIGMPGMGLGVEYQMQLMQMQMQMQQLAMQAQMRQQQQAAQQYQTLMQLQMELQSVYLRIQQVQMSMPGIGGGIGGGIWGGIGIGGSIGIGSGIGIGIGVTPPGTPPGSNPPSGGGSPNRTR